MLNYKSPVFIFSLALWVSSKAVLGQGLDGSVRGVVRDSTSGSVVPGVKITARNSETGAVHTTESNVVGSYLLPNLWPGTYSLSAESKGFKKTLRSNVLVRANQIEKVDVLMEVGEATVTVQDDALPRLVQSTTSQNSNNISGEPITALPNFGRIGERSPYALSILTPPALTQPGGLLGAGGSVTGSRTRFNSFTLDGVDNNRLDATGLTLPVIPEAVEEFSFLSNPFSAEYGHSAASQFNVVTKSGTNRIHGDLFVYGSNRKLNALDSQEQSSGGEQNRYDYARAGATVGGPIFKDRLFGFMVYQYQALGTAAIPYRLQTVTNEGLETINEDIRGLNSAAKELINNKSVWPTALVPNGNFTTVRGSDGVLHQVELGDLLGAASNYLNQRDWQTNVDYISDTQQIHGRFFFSNYREPSVNPQNSYSLFNGETTLNQYALHLSQIQPLRPNLVRETRLLVRRRDLDTKIPEGYASNANFSISSLGLYLGPNRETPESRREDLYQFVNNLNWVKGRHTLKLGADIRWWNAPTKVLPNSRGSYDWRSLESFLKDEVPTGANGAFRGVAETDTFEDKRNGVFGFIQDDFRFSARLTLNLGFRYEFMGNPRDAAVQADNEVATVPGTLDFRKPQTDKNNWAPRLGFAYDLFGTGNTVLRGGAGVSYDVMFGDLSRLSLPPQFQQVMTPSLACTELSSVPNYCRNNSPVGPPNARGFLTSGGLPGTAIPPNTVSEARSATKSYIPDTVNPLVYSWSLGLQHEFRRDWLIEARYLGTRGTRLPIQNNRNPGNPIPQDRFLPTYISASEVPANAAGAPSLADVLSYRGSGRRLLQDFQFTNEIIAYDPIGNSIYHGGSLFIQRRPTRGLFFQAGYTWGHVIDDASQEISTSTLNPARAEDSFNLSRERGTSDLNRTHHFALAWSYQLPGFGKPDSVVRKLLTGWQLSGLSLIESGQPITPQSGRDVNNDLYASSDRVVFNPNGDPGRGSDTLFVVRDGSTGATSITATEPSNRSTIVGYVAADPSAGWIATRLGGQTNSGRNVIELPGLNNWNLALSRRIQFSERKSMEFRVDLINAFNQRQYNPNGDFKNGGGSIFSLQGTRNPASNDYANVSSANFLNNTLFNSSGRVIQVGIKFAF
jgi:Carboxypeptidase regulatory-like domain